MKKPAIKWAVLLAVFVVCSVAVVLVFRDSERLRGIEEQNRIQNESIRYAEEMAKVGR